MTACASLGVAFYYCWDLTLVITATIPLSALVLSTISKRIQPSIRGQQKKLAGASQSAHNCFSNIDTVKYFNGQVYEAAKYNSSIRQAGKFYLQQAQANALEIAFVRFITLAMFAQGFWYGYHLVSNGTKTTGVVITTFWSCLTATQSFEEILPHMLVLEKGKVAASALSALAGASARKSSANCGLLEVPSACQGHLTLNNVRCPLRLTRFSSANTRTRWTLHTLCDLICSRWKT